MTAVSYPFPLLTERQDLNLPAAITWAASKQTYYTVRYLVDRQLVSNAYRAYAYFRWVDDRLDAQTPEAGTHAERAAFINRQKALLESCYQGQVPGEVCPEEAMLMELVRSDREKNSGLQAYLRNLMAVMIFDVQRRDELISQAELADYTRWLATAVTEAMHYFIGHDRPAPRGEARYLAVQGAHIAHMLRDTLEDVAAGYVNIPREFLEAHGIAPQEVDSPPYREWVRSRVALARACFKAGRVHMARVKSLRCRLAGFAYMARFEWLLGVIERDGYRLRAAYPERTTLKTGLWMARTAFGYALLPPGLGVKSGRPGSQPVHIR
jgi:phytoene/squalene synthetase